MINVSKDIQSLTTFKRDTTEALKQIKKSGRPLVLTVQGRAEAVVMSAESYHYMAEQLDTLTAIRRGLEQAKRGLGRGVDEVFTALNGKR